ncbi:response regulator [Methanosphaerula palustris]|uniref:Response regulator receiver protein n=1 Tax=Methanosphaerula palustris (strain ATCC BAA-1556 / DSM 19958 / E1-9c) TaxID=521011 RepID=B8GE39_METPE|nr:response regulator [Methanosphaerula palustris]ACL17540.1 response regulator receiver protein [Methanosphaerula palustris E1-9c]
MARILIIDDSSFQRGIIRKTLQQVNYETIEAKNGREGLERVLDDAPDLILLDLVMPEMDGFTVLSELQKLKNTVPVLVLTADIQEITRDQCLELGAAGFLNKPVKMEDLTSAVLGGLGA